MSGFENFFQTLGKYSIYFTIVILVVLGIYFLYLSFQTSKLDNQNLHKYKAIIKNSTCNEKIINSRRTSRIVFDCNLTLEFMINDVKIEKKYRKDSNIKYNNGDVIEIYYNEKTDTLVEMNPNDTKKIYLIISILCFIISGLLYRYRKNEFLRYFFGFDTLLN